MAKRSAAGSIIRDEIAALKRERTLRVAVDLFYEKGYDNTTLDEVAERLGVTKPFIYANFGSKTQLLAEICARGVRAAEEALDAVLAKRPGPRDSLEMFARNYVTAVLESQKHIAVCVREEKNLESEAAMLRAIEAAQAPGADKGLRAQRAASIPDGRYAEPEEVANLMVYLASDYASHIAGQGVQINGGSHA